MKYVDTYVISDLWCHVYGMRLNGDEMLLC